MTVSSDAETLMERQRLFNEDLNAALRSTAVDPATAIEQLDILLSKAYALESEIRALSGGSDPMAEYWRDTRVMIHTAVCDAALLLDRKDKLQAAIKAGRAEIAELPNHPAHATLDERLAELASDPDEVQRLMQSAFDRYVKIDRARDAVQNRMRAATLAGVAGHTGQLRALSGQAIDIARQAGLRRHEFECRIHRFSMMLMQDRSGETFDELRRQLDYTGELRGALSDDMQRAYAAAFSGIAAVHAVVADGTDVKEALRQAAEQAAAFAFARDTGRIQELLPRASQQDVAWRATLAATLLDTLADLHRLHVAQLVSLYLLAADFKQRAGDLETSAEILDKALTVASTQQDSRLSVLMAMTDVQDALGKKQRAISCAEQAVATAAHVASAAQQAQATAKLKALKDGNFRKVHPPEFVATQLMQANQALLNSKPADALAICESLLPVATDAQSRRQVLNTRCLALDDLGRFAEAEADVSESLRLIHADLSTDYGGSDRRILEEENLGLLRAMFLTEARREKQAWLAAEAGRARRLKQVMGLPEGNWEATRQWLGDHRAAIVSVASIRWGTLVLSAGPNDAEPHAVLVRGGDIRDLLGRPNLKVDSGAWTDLVLAAADSLSATLIPAIRDRLIQLTVNARVLHVIPNGMWFDLPWAALHLSPGQPLGSVIPLAVATSADLLLHRAGGAPLGRDRSCLAVAAGQDQTGFNFNAHLAQVASAGWAAAPMSLSGNAAGPKAIADLAGRYDVLFVASHGEVSGDTQDVSAASVLHLANETTLTAHDIADWRMKPGLVFLNACQSGRFRRASRTELGGFPGAFLGAGSRTVIAPLVHVDPVEAGNLAALFFTKWLRGSTAGEALKAGCDTLRSNGASPRVWGTYALYGDAFL